MSTHSEYLATQRKSFENCFNILNKNLDKYGHYVPWLLFKVRNQYADETRDALVIDTYNSQATVTLPNGTVQKISHIMLTNFEYSKNGSGSANSFSISFAFNPAEKADGVERAPLNPEIIDMALMTSSILELNPNESENKRDGKTTIAKHQVYMRYGYTSEYGNGVDATSLVSPEYFGQALEAKSELRDGLIYYTITGYSNITYLVNLEVDIPQRGDQIDAANLSVDELQSGKKATGTWKVSDAMWEAIVMYFGDSINGRNPTIQDFEKIFPNKKVIVTNLTNEDYSYLNETETMDVITASGDHETLWEYLDRVKKLVNFPCNEELDESSRVTLEWRLDEYKEADGYVMHFYIYPVDPRTPGSEGDKSTIIENDPRYVNVVYEYPSKSNNIVKSFTPDFNFETVWGSDILADSDNLTSYYADEYGNVFSYENISSHSNTLSGDGKYSSLSSYASAIQYNYSADFTTLGIPADIPIGTVIRIRPIINGKEYHYGGYYMIIETTDRIDTQGYYTEYKLFKLIKEKKTKVKGVNGSTIINTSKTIWKLTDANGNIIKYDSEEEYEDALKKQEEQQKADEKAAADAVAKKKTHDENVRLLMNAGKSKEEAERIVTDLEKGAMQGPRLPSGPQASTQNYNRPVTKPSYSNLDIRLANKSEVSKLQIQGNLYTYNPGGYNPGLNFPKK